MDKPLGALQTVEGIVVDVGWYRTTIRSFERELYTIPNSVFSRNVVLNITRKNKEWRFFEFFGAFPGQQPACEHACTHPCSSCTLLSWLHSTAAWPDRPSRARADLAGHGQACAWRT